MRKHGIDLHCTEPSRHNQSKVEGVIRELQKQWFRVMSKKRVPHHLWDYGIRWVCEVMQRTASTSGHLIAHTPLEQLTGETPDISEYLDLSFYDLCWYNDNAGLGETKLGQWLGVSHRIGSLMSYWILTIKGNVITRTTISWVTNLEMQEDLNKSSISEFNAAIKDHLNDDAHIIVEGGKTQPFDWAHYPMEDDPDFRDEFLNVVSNEEVKDADESFTPEVYDDTYLNMELSFNRKCTKTLSKAPCLVALRMSLTLHLLLFAQSM